MRDYPIASILVELERHDLLPTIIFRTARAQCDNDALYAAKNKRLHLKKPLQDQIRNAIKEVTDAYDIDLELIRSHPQYAALVTTGIGGHHAGQLLTWRLVLEELMTRGLLRALVATGTVAAGVDFPARTVVITSHSRRGAEGFQNLSVAELQQMSGRAGRRGKDTVGFCVVAPSMYCDARVVFRTSRKRVEPLRSAYFPSPSTVLNLLRYRNVDDLRYTVERSLASFVDAKEAVKKRQEADSLEEKLEHASDEEIPVKVQKREWKKVKRLRREADELDVHQQKLIEQALKGLASLGYLEEVSLSSKGYWAANICTSIVLELAEIIEAKLLDNCSLEQIVAIVASVSGDEHRKYLPVERSALSSEVTEKLREIVSNVASANIPGVVDTMAVVPQAASTVLKWMHTESWQVFRNELFLNGVAEGDAARVITQTAEHLNQLARLSDSHPKLAEKAFEAKLRLLRPPLTEVLNVEAG